MLPTWSASWQLRILVYLAIVLIAWVVLVLGVQRRFLYPRHLATEPLVAGSQRPGVEPIWVDSIQGRIEGWLVVGRGVSPQRPGPAVIFAHGNAERIGDWWNLAQAYRDAGVTVLLGEYRGYGQSAGKPSQHAIVQDFVGFVDLVAGRPDVDPARIVLHGRSLGGSVMCAVAVDRPPAAMIIQSSFTSVADMVPRWLVPRVLLLDRYDSLGVIEKFACPILIMHGRRDNIVPYRQGLALHAAARHSQLITYDCGHNDFPPDWGVFWGDVISFLRDQGIVKG